MAGCAGLAHNWWVAGLIARAVFCAALLFAGAANAGERVVTLAPHLAELVFAAGAGEQLVGVSRFTDYPPAAAQLPRIGDGFALSYERVLALRPSLVLAWSGGTPLDVIARLRKLGLEVHAVEVSALDDIPRAVAQLGELLDTAEAAKSVAAALRQRIDSLSGHAGVPVRVYYQVSSTPLYTLNGDSIVSDAIARCGGVNVFADLPTIAPLLGRESVLMAKPEVIFYSTPGGNEPWRGFDAIPAVRDGRTYKINPDLLARPGPRFVDGAEQLCSLLANALN